MLAFYLRIRSLCSGFFTEWQEWKTIRFLSGTSISKTVWQGISFLHQQIALVLARRGDTVHQRLHQVGVAAIKPVTIFILLTAYAMPPENPILHAGVFEDGIAQTVFSNKLFRIIIGLENFPHHIAHL